jgi:hypothetical protein
MRLLCGFRLHPFQKVLHAFQNMLYDLFGYLRNPNL